MSVEDLLNQIEDLLEEGKGSLLGGGKIKVDADAIRSIISAEDRPEGTPDFVRFALKRAKVHLFRRDTEERLRFRL